MKATVKCNLLLHADDSALLVSGKYASMIEQVLSGELNAVNEWLEQNAYLYTMGKLKSIPFWHKRVIMQWSGQLNEE